MMGGVEAVLEAIAPPGIDCSTWEHWLPASLLAVLRAEQKEAVSHIIKCVTVEVYPHHP